MGVEFRSDSGLEIRRRTVSCDVCRTVFLDGWPTSTTTCHDCGAPLCTECAPGHTCPSRRPLDGIAKLRLDFCERMLVPPRRA